MANKSNIVQKIVYIAHPIAGDLERNLERIRVIVKMVNHIYTDIVPFVPYYADVVSLDDNDPGDRARGIANSREIFLRGVIDEVWLFGDEVSPGMRAETELAKELGIPVFSTVGDERPAVEFFHERGSGIPKRMISMRINEIFRGGVLTDDEIMSIINDEQ